MKSESYFSQFKLWIFLHKKEVWMACKALIPILVLILAFYKLPLLLRSFAISKLDSETIGVVDEIEKNIKIHESFEGGRLVVNDYTVKYHYEFNGDGITRQEIINRNLVSSKQRSILSQLETGDSILVKYNSNDLQQSKIILK